MSRRDTLLAERLQRACRDMRDRVALSLEGRELTYGELHDRAARLSAVLARLDSGARRPVALLASRSASSYVSIVACHYAGCACMPLWMRAPGPYNAKILGRSGTTVLVADAQVEAALEELLGSTAEGVAVVCPDRDDVSALRGKWPRLRFVAGDEVASTAPAAPAGAGPDDLAYVIHTSGSTGEPKGVTLTHGGVSRMVDTMLDRYGIVPEDRVGQFADLTFDVAIADTLTAWIAGAALCCPSHKTLLNPGAYLREERVTVMETGPSYGALLLRLGALKPGRYPALRATVFAGEPLPCSLAKAWSQSAPGSVIDNLYGPAECTVHATGYRWDASRTPAEAENGIVPIGTPLPGFQAAVLDDSGSPVAAGAAGELFLSGPQVSPGYLGDPRRTAEVFGPIAGLAGRWYRTGDRVRSAPAGGAMQFLGRRDQQIKVGGIRVELGEVEAGLRDAAGGAEVACVGWPVTEMGVSGIVGFVCGDGLDARSIREAVRRRLPAQLVPRDVRVVAELPRTRSGKVDRGALKASLEAAGA